MCYSNHSSYDEIKKLLLFIKPKKISLSVLPEDELEKRTMLTQVNLITRNYSTDMDSLKVNNENEIPECISTTSFKRIKSMNSNQIVKKQKISSSDSEASEDEDFFAKCKMLVESQKKM